jgi:uncharacterized protein
MEAIFFVKFCLLGGIIGFLTGMLGIGGGFLLVPLLNVLGVPYNIAVGTSLVQIAVSALTGTIIHFRQRYIHFTIGLLLLTGSIIGSEAGARLLDILKNLRAFDIVMNSLFLGLLGIVSVFMYKNARSINGNNKKDPVKPIDLHCFSIKVRFFPLKKTVVITDGCSCVNEINIFYLVLAGFLTGALSGLLGVGGGFILAPIMIGVFKIPAVMTVGTGLFQMIFTSLYGAGTHFVKGNVDLKLAIVLVVGGAAGSFLGARLTKKIRGKKIRLFLGLVTSAGGVIVLIKLIMAVFVP